MQIGRTKWEEIRVKRYNLVALSAHRHLSQQTLKHRANTGTGIA